jgi:hypothetical protein
MENQVDAKINGLIGENLHFTKEYSIVYKPEGVRQRVILDKPKKKTMNATSPSNILRKKA